MTIRARRKRVRLLGESIDCWVKLEKTGETSACPLCEGQDGCLLCPIDDDTGRGCNGTPVFLGLAAWNDALVEQIRTDKWSPTKKQAAAVRAVTDYLRKLKKREQAALRRELKRSVK